MKQNEKDAIDAFVATTKLADNKKETVRRILYACREIKELAVSLMDDPENEILERTIKEIKDHCRDTFEDTIAFCKESSVVPSINEKNEMSYGISPVLEEHSARLLSVLSD